MTSWHSRHTKLLQFHILQNFIFSHTQNAYYLESKYGYTDMAKYPWGLKLSEHNITFDVYVARSCPPTRQGLVL